LSTPTWNPSLYDKAHSFIWKHGASLLELASVRDGERVLDLGYGTGHLAARLAEAGGLVLGVDKSAEMIAQAKASYPHLTFEVADALNLPFDSEFDLVFSNATLHWVKPPERAAASIARALKPGGRLVLEMGGRGNIARITSSLFKVMADAGYPITPDENPWYFPSVSEYTSVLEAQGWR
jgi:ubiquinone/menaquinone biosynthesis C-methylase UbiE